MPSIAGTAFATGTGGATGAMAAVEVPVWLAVLAAVLALGAAAAAVLAWRRMESASRRYALLADLATVGGDHPPSETAQRLCDIAVPVFADLAALDVAVGDEATRLAARFDGPQPAAVERALLRRNPLPEGWATGSQRAFQTGRVHEMQPVPEAALRTLAATPTDEAALLASGITAALFLPLAVGERPVGSLTFARRSPRRRFSREDIRFAQIFAGRASLVLDRASLHARIEQTEGRLERMVGQLEEAVLLFAEDGGVVYANEAAAGLLRVPSASTLVGASIDNVMAKFELRAEDGSALGESELPRVRALAGEDAPPPLLISLMTRATGERRWVVTRASRLVEPGGTFVLVVTEDVTEVKEAERFERTLARAGEVTAAALDDREMLERVAEVLVPELADWCRIDLLDPRGDPEPVVIAHANPERVALGWELARRFPADAEQSGIVRVLRTGMPERADAIPDSALEAVAQDAEHLRLLRSVGFGASMLVPMLAGGRAVGVLTLVRDRPRTHFEARDATLAAELGRRLGASVETARLHRERRRIADTLQAALMPPEPPELADWHIAAHYRAAGDANHVGGDFYDVVEHDGELLAVVGDVAGKGATAAALTARARHVLATAMRLTGDMQRSVGHLNAALYGGPATQLVTIACAASVAGRPGELVVLAAGHPPPYVVRAGGAVEQLECGGPMLGSVGPWEWPEARVVLAPGDTLLLYTDGVIDAAGPGGRFGEERLAAALAGGPVGSAGDVLGRVVAELVAFEEGPQRDDVALLALRRVGAAGGAT